ncbi:MAG TPA: nitroreductase family protein [Dehalococcoidia bacterium]|nr:nitroreductase family protein [Dehalococcoidia bacterium]
MDIAELEDFLSYQRAIRSFDTSRPVDEATVETLLRCATFAPSGGNRQTWRFIVLRDAAIKAELTQVYAEEAQKYLGRPLEGQTPWTDVPVLIVACSEKGGGGPSIFPAVQNLLLAARALGLGSVLTTLWKGQEPRVRRALGVPDEIEMHAVVPIGWPDRKYGRGKRKPIAEVTYRDRLGNAW